MTKSAPPGSVFTSEQEVQNWLEKVIAEDGLAKVIQGRDEVDTALDKSTRPDFWPTFPIDYLSRRANLRAASAVLASLHSLKLITKNTRNLSAAKGERLFTDLLYCAEGTSTFVVIEVKNQSGSVREAITELLAYEHEILNLVPFSGYRDIKLVMVSRDFPTLLDHAITGLNTWSRREILCLRFDDASNAPLLHVHIPKAWSAIGQTTLPVDGLVTGVLSFRPSPELTEQEVRALCETAAALLVREAERAGGSGFAAVAHNHFYPGLADGPFLILAGVVNPFSFAQWAMDCGFLNDESSPLAKYLLEGGDFGDLALPWSWTGCDGGAARDYLSAYGSSGWESFSNWRMLRDTDRWRYIGMDRHLAPVSIDFWGVLGDYARDAVRNVERMRNFKQALAKPGFDWRYPLLGVLLLDDIAGHTAVDSGQWTFSALFETGLRLGRYAAIASQYADADERNKRLLRASVFWAEVDVFAVVQELVLRYQAAIDLTDPPPLFRTGSYENGKRITESAEALVEWIDKVFIGDSGRFMHEALRKGFSIYAVFDPQFGASDNESWTTTLRAAAIATARDWLKWSVVAATGMLRDSKAAADAISDVFGQLIPLNQGKEPALAAVDGMGEDRLIEALLKEIPRIVNTWQPQLAHSLAPMQVDGFDWDWLEDQIKQARGRGQKRPCLMVGADGQVGVGIVPPEFPAPAIDDPLLEVLVLLNLSGSVAILKEKWVDLRSGNISWGANKDAIVS